ncbi:MAG: FdrA family protein, partial [Chloroflexota bacterium]|nr:FdrA family protein [Chloroflexota bacterium]
MIDFRLRNERIIKEATDPETAVILLDLVLGYGAHPDPAGALLPAVQEAQEIASRHGRQLAIVASVCGTEEDPQDLLAQEERLRVAGVTVLPSNARAARLAGEIVTVGRPVGSRA